VVEASLPDLPMVRKAVSLEPEHSGWMAVLRLQVAGKAMLRAALEVFAVPRNR
jgi:hypothetical protein